jgi:hypothetical protein
MMSRRRWLGSWGVLCGAYLALGAIRVIGGGDPQSALIYVILAAVTFGFVAATLPLIVPRRPSGGEGPPPGDDPSGGEPPPPPWWPEFEREFWSRVRSGEAAPWSRSPEGGSDRPRERTSA